MGLLLSMYRLDIKGMVINLIENNKLIEDLMDIRETNKPLGGF